MAAGKQLKGWMSALVTPFRDGAVDEAAFRKLVNWQIEQGIQGLVPVGTTGESPRFPMTSTAAWSRRASPRPGAGSP